MSIKKPPPDDPKQSARFVETAKALEFMPNNNIFARAFKKIIPKKPRIPGKTKPTAL
jgi:hypothetical protein